MTHASGVSTSKKRKLPWPRSCRAPQRCCWPHDRGRRKPKASQGAPRKVASIPDRLWPSTKPPSASAATPTLNWERARRCRLVVFGVEVGGSRQPAPAALRATACGSWVQRWSGILSVAAISAMSLLKLPLHVDEPELHLADSRWTAAPARVASSVSRRIGLYRDRDLGRPAENSVSETRMACHRSRASKGTQTQSGSYRATSVAATTAHPTRSNTWIDQCEMLNLNFFSTKQEVKHPSA